MIHILPVNDTMKHLEETTCECKPELIIENGEMIIVHNAYDGREMIEIINTTKCKLCNDMKFYPSGIYEGEPCQKCNPQGKA